jgi:hypothetical protein
MRVGATRQLAADKRARRCTNTSTQKNLAVNIEKEIASGWSRGLNDFYWPAIARAAGRVVEVAPNSVPPYIRQTSTPTYFFTIPFLSKFARSRLKLSRIRISRAPPPSLYLWDLSPKSRKWPAHAASFTHQTAREKCLSSSASATCRRFLCWRVRGFHPCLTHNESIRRLL